MRLSGVFVLAALQVTLVTGTTDPYEQGQALIESGDVEAALNYWILVRDSLSAVGAEDPRIATAFIGAVTEADMERYEEIATSIFYWGFSGQTTAEDVTEAVRDEIVAEVLRTFTIVDSLAANSLAERAQRDPATAALAIKRFWIERDPTPTTTVNERLIQHWERIAHSRREYVYNRSSPYDTDDRGTLYVKYGEADRVLGGHLGVNQSELRQLGLPFEVIAPFDRQPQYEVWRYGTLEDQQFTYFLFGNVDGLGPFEMVEGLHEILPREVKMSSRRFDGIGLRYYLEILYYNDLADIGGPYARRLGELDRLWYGFRRPSEGIFEAASRRYVDDDIWIANLPLPASFSELDEAPRSALSAQVARILVDSEPRLLALATSSPLWKPTFDPEEADGIRLSAYTASHTVILRDSELGELVRADMLPVGDDAQVSTMLLRHAPEIGHISVTAEHKLEDSNGAEEDDPPLPGQSHFAVGPPLTTPISEFEVSDIVVGIAPSADLMDASVADLPVPLLPATRLWKEDLLRIYFEVYHPQSPIPPTMEVSILVLPKPDKDDFWERDDELRIADLVGDGTQVSLTVQMDSEAPVGHHYLDLDLRNEGSGPMMVIVQVTDSRTGATRFRAAPVHILEF